MLGFTSYSKEDLGTKSTVHEGQMIICPQCGKKHILQASLNKNGDKNFSILFYECEGNTYLAALNNKLLVTGEKTMKTKSGFKITINGSETSVYFRSYNNRVVKCWLKDEFLGETFVGIAKCNPVDKFNEESGRTIAIDRAIYKRQRAYANLIQQLNKQLKQKEDAAGALMAKYFHLNSKGKLEAK